ncbi:GMC oxidoreductase [Piloderma croceum F 1598]|uniref:GMC oxidoreductase n=1 Tax=Piloderma croceum (strain F 1598) TaxID=765440 RepID=A0A0C3FE27_PILCF|nr:GMC oxidoreductase [Piloderma croceum F 1598]
MSISWQPRAKEEAEAGAGENAGVRVSIRASAHRTSGEDEDEHITIKMWNANGGQMKAESHGKQTTYIHVSLMSVLVVGIVKDERSFRYSVSKYSCLNGGFNATASSHLVGFARQSISYVEWTITEVALMSSALNDSSMKDAQAFVEVDFDFIVIGGGAAGLPVATRLSENPDVKVGLIEAGVLHSDDPIVYTPRSSEHVNSSNYDWLFATEPQANAHGRVISVPRGKMLGGSTGINYMGWHRASKVEYDAWKLLSDPEGAWDSDEMFYFLKRAEAAVPMSENTYSQDDVADHSFSKGIGTDGPVKISYPEVYADTVPPFIQACNALSIPTNANPYRGNTLGVYPVMKSVDPDSGKRVDAVEAYFVPAASRQNLKVVTGAHATKIEFRPESDGEGKLIASRVQFVVDGKVFVANASKEVILSAGTFQTPQLLELSGIGDAARLTGLSIQPLIDLPSVGENLIDHVFAPVQYEVKPGIRTFGEMWCGVPSHAFDIVSFYFAPDELRNDPVFRAEQEALYESKKTGWMTSTDATAAFTPLKWTVGEPKLVAMVQALEETLKKERDSLSPLQKAQYEIQLDWLRKGETPQVLTVMASMGVINPEQGKSYFTMLSSVQHPFSRGSVHISTNDPLKPPAIDPKCLSEGFDLDTLLAAYRGVEKLVETQPLKSIIERQVFPPTLLMEDKDLAGYIRQVCSSGAHFMGTAAMARRNLGGVVGNDLKVYGTRNLRVADTSIIPLPMSTLTQATAYAIGEKAADLIKQDW